MRKDEGFNCFQRKFSLQKPSISLYLPFSKLILFARTQLAPFFHIHRLIYKLKKDLNQHSNELIVFVHTPLFCCTVLKIFLELMFKDFEKKIKSFSIV